MLPALCPHSSLLYTRCVLITGPGPDAAQSGAASSARTFLEAAAAGRDWPQNRPNCRTSPGHLIPARTSDAGPTLAAACRAAAIPSAEELPLLHIVEHALGRESTSAASKAPSKRCSVAAGFARAVASSRARARLLEVKAAPLAPDVLAAILSAAAVSFSADMPVAVVSHREVAVGWPSRR